MPLEPYLGRFPDVDPDAWIHPQATVIGDVVIGALSSVWPQAVLRGDDGPIRIGRDTSIQDGTVAHTTRGVSEVRVGDRVTVGHRVLLHGAVVEDDCLIGMGAILLDRAVIGRYSLVGAGALVTGNTRIPPGSPVLGSPARVVRACGPKEREMIEQGVREYRQRLQDYRQGERAQVRS